MSCDEGQLVLAEMIKGYGERRIVCSMVCSFSWGKLVGDQLPAKFILRDACGKERELA